MICDTCQQKVISEENTQNNQSIWSFNPFIYDSYQLMKNGFYSFYKNVKDKNNFFRGLNEDGYTYSQWYIYYLSSNMYKYKKLHNHIVWLFQIMSRYFFFREFIHLGRKDDIKHTTLHHFLKYMTNLGKLQTLILNLLIENGLRMEDEDCEGNSGYDYLNILSPEDKTYKNFLTKQYKILEKKFDDIVLSNIETRMKKCEICNEFIEKYEDMKSLKDIILQINLEEENKENEHQNIKDIRELIFAIIDYRQKCIDIYKKYSLNKGELGSIERHQYVVDIYKEIVN